MLYPTQTSLKRGSTKSDERKHNFSDKQKKMHELLNQTYILRKFTSSAKQGKEDRLLYNLALAYEVSCLENIRDFGEQHLKRNGQRLVEFCTFNSLRITKTFPDGKT